MQSMIRIARLGAVPLIAAGGLIFLLASLTGGNPVYGLSLVTFAAGVACFFAHPLSPRARSASIARGGLALCAGSALIDGVLDFAGAVGTATSVATLGIVAGGVLAVIGRTTRHEHAGDPSPS